MPHIKRIQSLTNRADASGAGSKKAGAPDHANWSRIPFKIFKSRVPKVFLFDATKGSSNRWGLIFN